MSKLNCCIVNASTSLGINPERLDFARCCLELVEGLCRRIRLLCCYFIVCGLLLILCSSASSAELIGPTEDPVRVGVGARLMGMGKAFVAVADDGSSIFVNPAGLTEIDSWYFLSMYSNLLNEIPYTTISFSHPFIFRGIEGGLAIAYVGSGVADIISPAQAGFSYFNYHNNVYLFSLAGKIDKSLSVGLNIKYFDEGFSGTVNASGTGKDIDLGLKYVISDQAAIGIALQNILPASMGGTLDWNSGHSESIPSLLKIGGAFKFFDNRLLLAIDNDFWIKRELPLQLHTGVEWELNSHLVVRGGFDQNISSASTRGVYINPTFGVGLRLWGSRLDYAYHPYHEEQGNITHFFSLSFSPSIYEKTRPLVPAPEKKPDINIIHPKDKYITGDERIKIKGKINKAKIRTLRVNGAETIFSDEGFFQEELKLNLGKNTIWVAGYDQAGKQVKTKQIRILRVKTFVDVPSDYWAKDVIERLGTLGIFSGYKDGKFKPGDRIRRADLLTFLVKRAGLPAKKRGVPFKDVKSTTWFAPYLRAAYDAKLVRLNPSRKFRPSHAISRLEATILLLRFSKTKIPAKVFERPYQDISSRHWAIKAVSAAKQEGFLGFAKEELYPKKKLTRAEFAYMISKTPEVRAKIKTLLDFEKSYQDKYPF